MIGIYKFTAPDGKVYVGQSKNLEIRYNEHKWGKRFVNPRFLESANKFGFDNHTFEILCECELSELNKQERYFQDIYNVCGENGLNCRLTPTDGKPIYIRPETLVRMGAPKKGKLLTEEHKAKIGASKVGKKRDPELMKRIAANRKPLILTDEQRKKISERNKGHKYGVGRVVSNDTKKKISENSKEWHQNNLNPASKLMFDTGLGIYFETLTEAATAHNLKKSTLCAMLTGRNRNRTNLIYA